MLNFLTNSSSRRINSIVIGGAFAGLTLATAGNFSPTPAQAIEVGNCFNYSASTKPERVSSSPAVDCAGPHTAQTFWVGVLPASFGVPEKASSAARLKATRACTSDRINSFIGLGNRKLPSRFQSVPVFPSAAQWNAGERAVRCDVILRGGKSFKSFNGPITELVANTPADQFNFCTPGVPGNRTTSAYPCTKPKKNWIMVLDRDLGSPTTRFPGSRTVERKTKNICEKTAKAFVTQKKFYPWWAIWPTQAGWQRGERTAQCFVPYEEFIKTAKRRS